MSAGSSNVIRGRWKRWRDETESVARAMGTILREMSRGEVAHLRLEVTFMDGSSVQFQADEGLRARSD